MKCDYDREWIAECYQADPSDEASPTVSIEFPDSVPLTQARLHSPSGRW
jgi:hypothetical protein